MDENYNYRNDISVKENIASAKECQAVCNNVGNCNFFTYNQTDKYCALKSNVTKSVYVGAISGPRTCPGNFTPYLLSLIQLIEKNMIT